VGEEKETRGAIWSRFFSRQAQFVLDISVLCLALIVSYLLRFEFQLDSSQLQRLLAQLPLVLLIQIGALVLAGVYSFIWRYVGLAEMASFIRAALWSAFILLIGRLALPNSL
jgi:FlaA1/EpsC-like NDP-sugar epimerase